MDQYQLFVLLYNEYLADLRSKFPFGQGPCNLSVEGTALLRVSEVLTVNELEFPILMDEGADGHSIIFKRGTVDGGKQERMLHHGCML